MSRWPQYVVPACVLVLGLALRAFDPPLLADARLKIFDLFQELKPRAYTATPVRVIDLDDASLDRLGQWPWPRTLVARLVERLHAAGAAAIAFDIVFSEPDRTSPARVVELWPEAPGIEGLRDRIAALPDHDAVLAEAVGAANVATGFALTDREGGALPALKAGFAHAGDGRLDVAGDARGREPARPHRGAARPRYGAGARGGRSERRHRLRAHRP